MTEILKVGTPEVVSVLVLAGNRITGTVAGEDLAAGDACYIGADGFAYRSLGTAGAEATQVRGFAAPGAVRGELVTLVFDVTMRYGEQLPPGMLYVSGSVPGGLTDTPSPGATRPVALQVDATRIHLFQS